MWVIPDSLLELRLRGGEPSDKHQIAAENFVRLSIFVIELERFRKRLYGFTDLSLGEQTVAQGIPSPRRFRVLLDISSKERLNLLKSSRTDVAFEFGDALGIVRRNIVSR